MKLHRMIQTAIDRSRESVQDMPAGDIAAIAGSVALAVIAAMVWLRTLTPVPPPDFTQYEAGEERKEIFFDYFLPLVDQRNEEILALRGELQSLRAETGSLSPGERRRAEGVARDYGLDSFDASTGDGWDTLLRRVDIVPPSLALAQAANESAWGTSRFARDGNNYYGQWCFVRGCGLVPGSREEGADHEVAAFSSAEQSVERYIRNLNRHNAYTILRRIREELRRNAEPIRGTRLAAGLTSYSERGQEYIDELRSMIRSNGLAQYDGRPEAPE